MSYYQLQVVTHNGWGVVRAGPARSQFIYANIRRAKGQSWVAEGALELCVGDRRRTGEACSPSATHGLITSWGDMEITWKHISGHSLKLKPCSGPVLITKPALSPAAN